MDYYLDAAFKNNLVFWDKYLSNLLHEADEIDGPLNPLHVEPNDQILLHHLKSINNTKLKETILGKDGPLLSSDLFHTCSTMIDELFADKVNVGRLMVFFLTGMHIYHGLIQSGHRDTAERLKKFWSKKYSTYRSRLHSTPTTKQFPGRLILWVSIFSLAVLGIKYLTN
ncbi:Bcl-2-like protein [Phascolarctid gammaherpesvirus 1]|uniref:Bcl-2-like protein n=1 Tax=Phascolarctid gammaherpesvirus 1 TaxID=2249313 RepID=A0A3Q8J606_9GAMA|nr:Bcl-2-like protein [Phascolarctid gammaherpesvirus 1]AZB49188.1 Bcl-2-like protein [Phascolarctid gammaherpesvirus 1]